MQAEFSDVLTSKTFYETGLPAYLCRVLQKANFIQPTPIQYHSIRINNENKEKNLVARSKSGTGKTIAFLSLLLRQFLTMHQPLQSKTYSIILLPTRELAVQVYQTLNNLLQTSNTVRVQKNSINQIQQKAHKSIINKLRIILTIGGISFEDDRKKYRQQPCHIVISTVGRLWQMLNQHIIILNKNITFVLDEGDKIICNKDDKFLKIISTMSAVEKKWLIYSATYTSKVLQQIKRFFNREKVASQVGFTYLHTLWKDSKLDVLVTDDVQIEQMETNEDKNYQQMRADDQEFGDADLHMANIKKYQIAVKTQTEQIQTYFQAKIRVLKELLSNLHYQKCLIFVQKKSFLQQIAQNLIDFDPLLMHGSLSQAARFRMMNQINKNKLILSSDLLARGIDIRLDLVILFDAKQTDNFWHRIGRTGRYGRAGVALSLDQLQDKQWKQYDQQQVNKILQGIDEIQQKSWFGTHLTQVGKWVDVDIKKQQQNGYKYYEPPPIVSNPHKIAEQIEDSLMDIQQPQNPGPNTIPSFNSQSQMIDFIKKKLLSCQNCIKLMNQTTQLTGYEFQIMKYMKN